MVRWRFCLVLAMLMLLPVKTASEEDDDDDQDDDDDDNNGNDDVDDEPTERTREGPAAGRRAPPAPSSPLALITRTMPKRPLECYVCAYKAELQLKSCLDPSTHRVHTMTCRSVEEKCFTNVISKGQKYESIIRGCRSSCVGTPEVTCCELNRCNNQAFAMPAVERRMVTANKSPKAIPQTVLFFVTVLLVLQTVVRVAIV